MGMLRASAGQVDLAPRAGTWMTGYAARIVPARGTHDPIMARAVMLDDGMTPLVIVSCDLLGFSPETAAGLRQRISEHAPISSSNILICCTHTHSGPASMPMRGLLGNVDAAWLREAGNKIVRLVSELPSALEPAQLALASATAPGIGFNRQDATRPTDDELSVVAVEATGGKALATIITYATHAVVLGPGNLDFSGDWPGAAAAAIARQRGGIGLVLQGACGDVDPVIQHERGWGKGTHDDAGRIGERLAGEAVMLLDHAPRKSNLRLGVSNTSVTVPLDPPPSSAALAEMCREWEVQRAQTAEPVTAHVAAAMLSWAGELRQAMKLHAVPPSLSVNVFAAALDDVRLVGLPLETYSDIALQIKRNLRPLRTIFAGYANGLIGYCPTRWAKEAGGYGPTVSARWFAGLLTPIGYGADERLIAETTALAQTL